MLSMSGLEKSVELVSAFLVSPPPSALKSSCPVLCAGDLGDDVVHVDATELLVCNNVNDVLTHGDNLATMITML